MATPGPGLTEKDFINEGYSKNPFPLWLWLFLLTTLVALLWGIGNWYSDKINLLYRESPFLQVTNREISLFLWQNPEFMRVNVKEKNAYLPAFKYTDKITVDVAFADQYAAAPPELLFRYHTWDRLVRKEFTGRPIPRKEFIDFLDYAEEWKPRFWPAAPQEYIRLVEGINKNPTEDLSTLSDKELPMPVRMAFQGWQNYFKDGDAINKLEVTQKQMQQFLAGHPHYARNYWINIVEDKIPNYLKSTMGSQDAKDGPVAPDEFSSFLRVAVYNFLKAENPKSTAFIPKHTK